jgi:hypothetical protein
MVGYHCVGNRDLNHDIRTVHDVKSQQILQDGAAMDSKWSFTRGGDKSGHMILFKD